MSVVKSKRGTSQLEVITKSRELAVYTIRNMDKFYKDLWRVDKNV